MFIHLLATLALGAVSAVFLWAIARTLKWKPPGYAYPVAVAAGMLGYAIYDEYSWYSRVANTLPPRLEVVRTYGTSLPYQPWTYAIPRVYRFDALDLGEARRNPADDSLVLVRLLRVTRNTSSKDVTLFVDCRARRYAEVKSDMKFDDRGLPLNPDWADLSSYPSLASRICSVAGAPASASSGSN